MGSITTYLQHKLNVVPDLIRDIVWIRKIFGASQKIPGLALLTRDDVFFYIARGLLVRSVALVIANKAA